MAPAPATAFSGRVLCSGNVFAASSTCARGRAGVAADLASPRGDVRGIERARLAGEG